MSSTFCSVTCDALPMVVSSRLACRLVMSVPTKICTAMPTAIPATIRIDWPGLVRRKRVAMRRLSICRGYLVRVDEFVGAPARVLA